jgi:protein gp37
MDNTPTKTELRDFTDQLESLHRRMDKFYAWAGILQKEFRAMQQRVTFLESQCEIDVGQSAQESAVLERLQKIKQDPKAEG